MSIIARQNEDRQNPKDFDLRDRKAFGDLVAFVETLQRENDVLLRKIINYSIMFVIFSIFLCSGFYYIFDYITHGRARSAEILLMMVIGFVSFLAAFFVYLSNHWRFFRREKRAYKDAMDIVHETYQTIREDLSPIERIEFKIRLSRLDN